MNSGLTYKNFSNALWSPSNAKIQAKPEEIPLFNTISPIDYSALDTNLRLIHDMLGS